MGNIKMGNIKMGNIKMGKHKNLQCSGCESTPRNEMNKQKAIESGFCNKCWKRQYQNILKTKIILEGKKEVEMTK